MPTNMMGQYLLPVVEVSAIHSLVINWTSKVVLFFWMVDPAAAPAASNEVILEQKTHEARSSAA